MTIEGWQREVIYGIELGGFYERDGQVYEVLTIWERPTMRLRNLKTGETIASAIGAPIFNGFVNLVPEGSAGGR